MLRLCKTNVKGVCVHTYLLLLLLCRTCHYRCFVLKSYANLQRTHILSSTYIHLLTYLLLYLIEDDKSTTSK